MSARKKLNSIYFFITTAVALAAGVLTGSITVFAICFALLAVGFLHDGSIRPDSKRR